MEETKTSKTRKTKKKPEEKKARTPLAVMLLQDRRQVTRLERRTRYGRYLERVARELREIVADEPDMIEALCETVGNMKLPYRPKPPDGMAQKAALEIVSNQILDRFDELFSREVAAQYTDPDTGREYVVVVGGTAVLMNAVDPKQYPLSCPKPAPTNTAPCSPARIAEYRRRVEAEEEVHVPGDANHLVDAVTKNRLNGSGMMVLGRRDELDEDEDE